MRLVDVDSLYRHLFTCSDGRICPNTDIDNFPIQFDVKTIKKIIRKEPIVFEIPDNATNGDVMKIIFPKIGVYDEWYDEPYQKGDNE